MAADSSKCFTPLPIASGRIQLQHRIIMAPMTRNRGVPLSSSPSNNVYLPDSLVATYYGQRASPGGLLITEGIPPSIEAAGMPHVPGLFHPAQMPGWRAVTDAVHSKGGYIYAQLWHAGRATIPQMTGGKGPVSSAATAWEDSEETYPFRAPLTDEEREKGETKGKKVRYVDHPPLAMSKEKIQETIGEFVTAAKAAMEVGFDGVEVNGGNGNLLDQFLHSNINARTDEYSGSTVEGRCRFPLELVTAISGAIGASNVGVRLEPAGLYQGTRGSERVETWQHLCSGLSKISSSSDQSLNGEKKVEKLSYVHFIEPRFDRIESEKERDGFQASWSLPDDVSNKSFRAILKEAGIPCFSCGGYDDKTCTEAIDAGWDAVVFARWFVSNPDLPERIRKGYSLAEYDRSRFYGSWDGVRENGYTTYATYAEA